MEPAENLRNSPEDSDRDCQNETGFGTESTLTGIHSLYKETTPGFQNWIQQWNEVRDDFQDEDSIASIIEASMLRTIPNYRYHKYSTGSTFGALT